MVTQLREWWGAHLVPEHERHREAHLKSDHTQWRATFDGSNPSQMFDDIVVRLPQFQLRQRVYCEPYPHLSGHRWRPGLFWVR